MIALVQLLFLILWAEIDRYTVHTMTLVLGVAEPLSLENVPQMSSTIIANNLCSHHSEARVGSLAHRVRERVPESWPSAARIELVVGFVEGSFAAGATVDSIFGVVFIELTRTRRLGAFLSEDAELFCGCVSSVRARYRILAQHTWRKLCLPFALGPLYGVVGVVCHLCAEKCAEEWNIGH